MDGKQLGKGIGALAASFFAVAMVTTFVLPNRPTPKVIRAFFEGLTAAIKSTIGVTPPAQTQSVFGTTLKEVPK